MTNGYAVSFNWRDHSSLDPLFRPLPATLAHMLSLLDGAAESTFAMWRKTPGIASGRISFSSWPREFLQSAGSSDAMAIELKRRDADGAYRLYSVGRDEPDTGTQLVTWASDDPDAPHSLTLPSNEVFTAAEALRVYLAYHESHDVPPGYRLRDLHIGGLVE